jgi:hypothetical protein
MPEDVSSGVRRQAREADQSPPFIYEIRMMEVYLSTPVHLHGVVLNHRDNFTFHLRVVMISLQAYSVLNLRMTSSDFPKRAVIIFTSCV